MLYFQNHSVDFTDQVRFQKKNPDSLFKNPDFLSKNLHFLFKNPDFLLKNLHFYNKTGAGAVGREKRPRGRDRGGAVIFALRMMNFVLKNDGFCIENDEFCIEKEERGSVR